jgi:flagellar export protein FliJ
MKKFAFTLETLLRHRKNLEEKERIELSRLYFQRQTEMNRRRELLVRQSDTLTELVQKRLNNADQPEMAWFYLYLGRLQYEIQACSNQIAKLEREIETQRNIVVESSKNTKVLDSLKVKQGRQYQAQIQKLEQKEVDDLVVTRFIHPQSE